MSEQELTSEPVEALVVEEIDAARLIKAPTSREIAYPYPGTEYICPSCEKPIPTRLQRNLAKPAKFAHMLNDLQKCPYCSFIFSYRMRAVVLQG